MSDQTPSSPSTEAESQPGQAIRSCLVVLLRLTLTVVLAVFLGLGLYFGIPAIYRYTIQPVERNLAQLNQSQAEQEQMMTQVEQRLDAMRQRLDSLEQQSDSFKQDLDEVRVAAENLETTLQADLPSIQSVQSTASLALEETGAALETLDGELQELNERLQALEDTQANLRAAMRTFNSQLQQETPLDALQRDLQILRAMQHMTRARLFLSENNLGLASQEITTAGSLLAALQAIAPESDLPALQEALDRLESAAQNLPSRPLLAAEDLEIAWQTLSLDLEKSTVTETVEPAITPTITPTPAP